MKNTLRSAWLILTVLMLSFTLILAGCNTASDGGEDTTSAPETEAPVPPVQLAGAGAPKYTIVRGDNAEKGDVDAAVLLMQYLKKCGLDVSIETDWEKNPVSDYEFVVGDTLRSASDPGVNLDFRDVGEKGFIVKVSGSRVYLAGGSPDASVSAVEYFLREYFGYTGDRETAAAAGDVFIAADYEYIEKQQYALTSLSVDGKNLHHSRIAWDDSLVTMDAVPAAKLLQEYFYKTCGVWLEIHENNQGEEPVGILLSAKGEGGNGNMRFKAENGTLVITTDTFGAFARGFNTFAEANIASASGDKNFASNFRYDTDLRAPVNYEEFGAAGDGKTNDIAAIIAAHDYANTYGTTVKATAGKTYYIGRTEKGADIRTDVDWTGVNFILDDSVIPSSEYNVTVFNILPTKDPYSIPVPDSMQNLAKGQAKLDLTLPETSIVILTDSNTKRYIRSGSNENAGSDQTDAIVVDKNGNVDQSAPIIWDYTAVTSIRAIPMDEKILTVKGGTFTTIAHDQEVRKYCKRGLQVTRSNVVLDGLVHYVTGEGEKGAIYSGILCISDCANVTVQNCKFAGHKKCPQPTGGNTGTYDISPSRVVNLTFKNCTQTNDIRDTSLWGVMGSNFCKNIILDGCEFSRFDAHQGVANVTIINSKIGQMAMEVIGCGTLRVENTTLYSGSYFFYLRPDYGSHWQGDAIVKNCTWVPGHGKTLSASTTYTLFYGKNTRTHDYGYECYMPTNITIEGLRIEDGDHAEGYKGIYLFADICSTWKSEAAEYKLDNVGVPYNVTEKLTISGYSSASGMDWRLSPNTFMFRNMEVVDLDKTPAETPAP